MEPDSLSHAFGLTLQVSFLDLILSGDNALVIALACRSLPQELRRRAVIWGTGFAIALRLALAALTGVLLMVPMLKLVGAAILLAIAMQLLLDEGGEEDGQELAEQAGHSRQLWNAVMLVVGADLALSLDNVVALAAAAQGSVLFLLLGLLLSVPLLMYGSLLLSRLMGDYPLLIPAGAAVLGWLAGSLAVGDALWGDWVAAQAPALLVVVPLLGAAFVLLESRIIRAQRRKLAPMPPWRPLEPLTRRLTRLGEAAIQPDAAVAAAILHAPPETPAPAPVAALPTARPAQEEAQSVAATAAEGTADEADLDDGNRLSPALKWLVGAAALLGMSALLWLIWHLLSQGFLPAPKHPVKLTR
ncbi:YjbE family putative metal transport protein [Chromobacterium paludis]|uniref:YjbE family putative metal transport protein n=1 Tax=Chromobacterium paludis TaxID=2605945 RepID=A0A5C1DGZ6_9NEIS|nr:YjbE family putative metal transport protein [Chromobacterium paludis]QEL56012.1 YjbE family putative metal transport protein [Chromobacterium paludis]